jgi:hypothetical protein
MTEEAVVMCPPSQADVPLDFSNDFGAAPI